MPALYLIRHGEPATTGVLIGQADPPLSAAGRIQAASISISEACAVYCSPLRRAAETASALISDCIVLPGLAEISYGDWDGLTWQTIEERWPATAAAKLARWTEITPPGGEEWENFRRRVLRTLAEILDNPLPAIIVAHEAVNAILAERLGSEKIGEFQQKYCEIKKYEV